MTGSENDRQQQVRVTRGRTEFARIMAERAVRDAIRNGRATQDAFNKELIPLPARTLPRRVVYVPRGNAYSRYTPANLRKSVLLPVKPYVVRESIAQEVSQVAARGWRGAVRKITDAWTFTRKGKVA